MLEVYHGQRDKLACIGTKSGKLRDTDVAALLLHIIDVESRVRGQRKVDKAGWRVRVQRVMDDAHQVLVVPDQGDFFAALVSLPLFQGLGADKVATGIDESAVPDLHRIHIVVFDVI